MGDLCFRSIGSPDYHSPGSVLPFHPDMYKSAMVPAPVNYQAPFILPGAINDSPYYPQSFTPVDQDDVYQRYVELIHPL